MTEASPQPDNRLAERFTGDLLLNRNLEPIRLWVPHRTMVVLGRSQDPGRECLLGNLARNGIPWFRRMGGGGAVVLTPGCLCLAIRFKNPTASMSTKRVTEKVLSEIHGLCRRRYGLNVEIMSNSDLTIAGRKFFGSSLRWTRAFTLYYGVMAVDDCSREAERYLSIPQRTPEYRRGRSHSHFMTHLSAHVRLAENIEKMRSAWHEELSGRLGRDLDWNREFEGGNYSWNEGVT